MQLRSFATTSETLANCIANVPAGMTVRRFLTFTEGGKHFLRRPDEKYLPFYASTRLLREAVEFTEVRFQQKTIDTITVQIGGRETLSQEEEQRLRAAIVA